MGIHSLNANERTIHGSQLEPLFRRAYILSGHAKVTLVSKVSGDRFTYKIEVLPAKSEGDKTLHFVSVLSGPDNQANYAYIGTVVNRTYFKHTAKSRVSPEAPSFLAWAWLWRNLDSDQVEVWHAGQCGRCGRELTTPESIQRGLGPVCAEGGK